MPGGSLRLAIIQLAVNGTSKSINLQRAASKIKEAASNGAQMIVLPECFNSPYGTCHFGPHSEPIPTGETCRMLSECSRQNSVWIIGGSIPERATNNRLYNTCPVYDNRGSFVGGYRKIHLFDIDLPGKMTFKESATLAPGNRPLVVDAGEWGRVGVGICYDLRFPQLASYYRHASCNLLVYPGAFNTTTGPLHWSLLQRARAVDNQLFVVTASPARVSTADYQAYGHSMIINPMGEVIAEADEKECIIYGNLELEHVSQTRTSIPISRQSRPDIF